MTQENNSQGFNVDTQGINLMKEIPGKFLPDRESDLLEKTEFVPEPISVEALTELDLSLLFLRVSMNTPEAQDKFYASLLEGIGYKNMENFGKATGRLNRINWFENNPDLDMDRISDIAINAYRSFAEYDTSENTPKLTLITDVEEALTLQQRFEEKDYNSYGFSYNYTQRIMDRIYDAEAVQSDKHKTGDDFIDATDTTPQDFVSKYILTEAFDSAEKLTDNLEVNFKGTISEQKALMKLIPQMLTTNLYFIIDGYLAYEDAQIEPNPYTDLVEIFEAGLVPIGGRNNEFFVFDPNTH